MKQKVHLIMVLLLGMILFNHCRKTDDFPVLKGPYLGQEPPGMTPEIFAPGIISTGEHDSVYTFLRGGKYCIFSRGSSSEENPIYHTFITEMNHGVWTKPVLTQFNKVTSDDTISLLPDKNTILFSSPHSSKGLGKSDKGHNIWIVKLTNTGLSNPRMFNPPLNSDHNDIFPSITNDGTIYFFSNRDDTFTNEDIYRSKLVNGKYTEIERLGSPVNTENDEIDPFIAPDESYLIYCSNTLDGFGGYDLYITFRTPNGSWTEPINMGEGINSSGFDWIPFVTPDDEYFFFNSDRSGNADVYWVDAKVIKEMKLEKFPGNIQNTHFPVLKGPYLGQIPPGMTPEIFAPEIFSKTQTEWAFDSVYSPCGNEFYFTKYFAEKDVSKIMCMKRVNDEWTKPEAVSFNGSFNNNNLCISPDGYRIFFKSWRPLPDSNTPEETSYIWYVHRTKGGWSEAQPVEYINEYLPAGHPSVSNTGTLYFRYRGKDNKGNADTHKSRFVNGTYSTPENLSHTLNTKYIEGDVCVAPDESFIIVACWDRPDNNGESDLYISFRDREGKWTVLENMGKPINTESNENNAMLSPDGKYLFFMRVKIENDVPKCETYWVDAGIIEKLKPNDLE